MPAIIRTSDKPYRWKIQPMPLDQIANKEKMLPDDYITADGYGITPAARRYLQPLTVGEAETRFKNGLPDFVQLKNVAVPKKLPAFTI